MQEQFDSIVVGGGVIGLSCALKLGQMGLKVLLCEQGRCGSGASGAAIRALWPASPLRLDYFTTLQRLSLQLYPQFVAQVQELSGLDVGYARCGALELIRSAAGYERAVREVAASRRPEAAGFELEILSADNLRKRFPQLLIPELGALYCAGAAKLLVPKFLLALQQAVIRTGLTLREEFAIKSLWRRDQQILGVVGPDGPIAAGQVILAAGVGCMLLDGELANHFPLHPVKGQAITLKTPHPWSGPIVRNGLTYIVPGEGDYVYVGSTTEPEAGYNLELTKVQELQERAAAIWPALRQGQLLGSSVGLRPKSPTQEMYLGPSEILKNLYLATGHYKTGIGMAPISAVKIAEFIASNKASVNLSVSRG